MSTLAAADVTDVDAIGWGGCQRDKKAEGEPDQDLAKEGKEKERWMGRRRRSAWQEPRVWLKKKKMVRRVKC